VRSKLALGLGLVLIFNSFVAMGFAEESTGSRPKISFVLKGGGNYVAVGDINDSLRSIDHLFLSKAYRGYSTDRIAQLNNWTGVCEAELRFEITRRFSLGISVSNAFHARKTSAIPLFSNYVVPIGAEAGSFSSDSDTRARMPIRLSAYYSMPLKSRLSLLIGAGAGYYSGKMAGSIDYEITDDVGTAWYRSRWETGWKSAFGFHGGLGAEYKLSKRIGVILEAQYVSAKIGNFDATMTADSNQWEHLRNYDPNGLLYRWGWGEDGPIGNAYLELIVWSGTPPEYGIMFGGGAAGTARLDLSGFSARFGIGIRIL
jgi:opacity protein-like surface antigen